MPPPVATPVAPPVAPPVAIVMGSQSDWPVMRGAAEMLDALNVAHEARIVSAHRTPARLVDFAQGAAAAGFRVIIAGAGGADGGGQLRNRARSMPWRSIVSSAAAHPIQPVDRPALRHNRVFILLWAAQAISNVGDLVFDTTLILWIATVLGHGKTWAPLALSGVMFAAMLPMLFVGPLAGIFIDRWDKRRTMLAADGARALLILLLALVAVLVAPVGAHAGPATVAFHLGTIYAVVFLASACAQFFNPARLVLIGDIVSEPARAQAAALGQMTQALAIMVGPAIAAVLFFAGGVGWALLLNAASFAASFAAILVVRPPRLPAHPVARRRGAVLREFGEGFRFFAASPTLRTILAAVIIAMAGGGALSSLNIFFITNNLHVSPHLYGWRARRWALARSRGRYWRASPRGELGLPGCCGSR